MQRNAAPSGRHGRLRNLAAVARAFGRVRSVARITAFGAMLTPVVILASAGLFPPEAAAPEDPEPAPRPYAAGIGNVSKPVIRHKIPVSYPKLPRKHRLEAALVLQTVVRKDGTVGSVTPIRCRVNKKGKKQKKSLNEFCPAFALSAESAVLDWVYEPATLDGEPVDVFFVVKVDFKLE